MVDAGGSSGWESAYSGATLSGEATSKACKGTCQKERQDTQKRSPLVGRWALMYLLPGGAL